LQFEFSDCDTTSSSIVSSGTVPRRVRQRQAKKHGLVEKEINPEGHKHYCECKWCSLCTCSTCLPLVHKRIRRAGRFAICSSQCNCRFYDDTQCPVCHCWFSACGAVGRYCERCQITYGETQCHEAPLEDDDGVEVEVQQDAGEAQHGNLISIVEEASDSDEVQAGRKWLVGRGFGNLKLDERTLARFGRCAFVPLRPFAPVPLPRTSLGGGNRQGAEQGVVVVESSGGDRLLFELASFLRLQRMGLLIDDSIVPVVRRKAEAFFRKHEVSNVERESLITRVIPMVFDKNPIENALDAWMKGKDVDHVTHNNLSYLGLRIAPPPWLMNVGWWITDSLICAGGRYRSVRIMRWQAHNPVRVLPKAR